MKSALWPKRRKRKAELLPGFIFKLLYLGALLLAVVAVAGMAFADGWTVGDGTGSRDGLASGSIEICQKSAHQVNWTQNVVNDRLKSGQITQAVANEIMSAEIANYAYACGPWPVPPGDIYMPGVAASPVPINTQPTLPVAPKTRPPCALTAAHCPARGY